MRPSPGLPGLEEARELDRGDALAPFRERFVIEDPELVYLDGNSLGRLPRAARDLAAAVVGREWGRGLIESWSERWYRLPERVGGGIARLIGADPDEVIAADSTSVNLFKLAAAALRAAPERTRVVTDALNFPTDLYILRSAMDAAGPGRELVVVPSEDGVTVPPGALAAAVDGSTALLALSHAAYRSAYLHDMAAVTALAHERGALVLWDLSHSAGALPVELGACRADLAVGCGYKYLNGGPGAPAFLYVRRDLQARLRNPVAGWFGRRDPFSFAPGYEQAAGIRGFLTGTPPVLSLAMLEPGVELLLEAGLARLREKSVRQTEFLLRLWEEGLAGQGYRLASPRDPERRGSHLSLAHAEGQRISRVLRERFRVVPDFRPPDTIRLGVCPLYTTFAELHAAAAALHRAAAGKLYEAYPEERGEIT